MKLTQHATWRDLSRPAKSSVVISAGVSAVLVLAAWMTPLSPVSMWRADATLGSGDVLSAAAQYDAIADFNPIAGVQRAALYRSAIIWTVDLNDPVQARSRWERYLSLSPEAGEAAAAWERVGLLYLTGEDKPLDAAMAFRQSYDLDPTDESAADRLTRTARALAEAGRLQQAVDTWDQVATRFPDRTSLARTGQAELRLSQGEVAEALTLYDAALTTAQDESQRSLAQLGAATCLERLGNLDEAIAELDQAEDLPSDVRLQRLESIRARQEQGASPL